MNFKCINDLSEYLISSFQENSNTQHLEITPELCPPNMDGEITVNCFRLTKPLRQKPDSVADAAVTFLQNHADVEFVGKVKAFVNISLKPEALFRDTISDF